MVKYSPFISLKKIHLTQIIKAIKSMYSKSKIKIWKPKQKPTAIPKKKKKNQETLKSQNVKHYY